MDYKERKWKSAISEGLCLYAKKRIKESGNPYAILCQEADVKKANEIAKVVYQHLLTMGMIK